MALPQEREAEVAVEVPEKERKRPADENVVESGSNAKKTNTIMNVNVNTNTAKTTAKTTNASKKPRITKIYDLAKTLGLSPGDRFEVQWDVSASSIIDENGASPNTPAEQQPFSSSTPPPPPPTTTTTRWWGATLLNYDGRTAIPDDDEEEDETSHGEKENEEENAELAIRTLDYDPYPEGGFPDQSLEDVMFLNANTLLSVDSGQELSFRKEGQEEIVPMLPGTGENGIEQVLNTITAAAVQSAKSKGVDMGSLSASQQALVAERMAQSKEKLLQALTEHLDQKEDKVLTAQDVPNILAQAFGGMHK